MQAHADFLFGPLGTTFAPALGLAAPAYDALDCRRLDWNAGARPWSGDEATVYRRFRDHARGLALGAQGPSTTQATPALPTGARPTAAAAAPLGPLDVLMIRRGSVSNRTCTGSCRRHLPQRLFADLEAFARTAGLRYRVAELDGAGLRAQIRLLAGARVVLGAHGAGLSGWAFAAPGTRVVELGRVEYPCFEPLARKLGLDYRACPATGLATAESATGEETSVVEVDFDGCVRSAIEGHFDMAAHR